MKPLTYYYEVHLADGFKANFIELTKAYEFAKHENDKFHLSYTIYRVCVYPTLVARYPVCNETQYYER